MLYLRELRITQTEQMLAEFLYGVDVYLGAVRDSNAKNLRSLVRPSILIFDIYIEVFEYSMYVLSKFKTNTLQLMQI